MRIDFEAQFVFVLVPAAVGAALKEEISGRSDPIRFA